MAQMEQDGEFGILSRVQAYLYPLSQKSNYKDLVKTCPEIKEIRQLLTSDWMPYEHKVHMLCLIFNHMPDDLYNADSNLANHLAHDLEIEDYSYGY